MCLVRRKPVGPVRSCVSHVSSEGRRHVSPRDTAGETASHSIGSRGSCRRDLDRMSPARPPVCDGSRCVRVRQGLLRLC